MSKLRMRYEIVRLGRRFTFGLLIVVALSACVLSSGRTGNIPSEGNATVKTQDVSPKAEDLRSLNFLVWVEKQQWKRGDPILLKLRVHNAGKVPVEGICSFRLDDPTAGSDPYKEGRNLWAPVVVQASGVKPARSIPGESASSVFNPGETIELEVDLNKLNWASIIQNSWPKGTFSQNAAAGNNYEFSFRMNVRIGETSETVESNKIKVSIK